MLRVVFRSECPIRARGGINFYRYVGNNPINLVDPFGQGPLGAGIGLVVGGTIGGILGFGGGVATGTAVAPGVGTVGLGIVGTIKGAGEGAVIGAALGGAIGDLIGDLLKKSPPKCKKNDGCSLVGDIIPSPNPAQAHVCKYLCKGMDKTVDFVLPLTSPCPDFLPIQ